MSLIPMEMVTLTFHRVRVEGPDYRMASQAHHEARGRRTQESGHAAGVRKRLSDSFSGELILPCGHRASVGASIAASSHGRAESVRG